MASVSPARILRDVLSQYADDDKWIGSTFEKIKRLSNTKVGDVGQDFVERLCDELGFSCEFPSDNKGGRSRTSPWDIRVEGVTFELKTATEDVNGSFQFNHVRYQRTYQGLLCVGIAPEVIVFDAWTKAAVTTGKAGTLVSMERRMGASYKLTKRAQQLRAIGDFENHLLDLISELENEQPNRPE